MFSYIAFGFYVAASILIGISAVFFFKADVLRCIRELGDIKQVNLDYRASNNLLKDFYYKKEYSSFVPAVSEELKSVSFKREGGVRYVDDTSALYSYTCEDAEPDYIPVMNDDARAAFERERAENAILKENLCSTAPLETDPALRDDSAAIETAPLVFESAEEKEVTMPLYDNEHTADAAVTEPLFEKTFSNDTEPLVFSGEK